jgi:hypothetical protein
MRGIGIIAILLLSGCVALAKSQPSSVGVDPRRRSPRALATRRGPLPLSLCHSEPSSELTTSAPGRSRSTCRSGRVELGTDAEKRVGGR